EFELNLASVREEGHILRWIEQPAGNSQMITRAVAHQDAAEFNRFDELLRKRLAQTDHKDVYIFVHGYNNTFQDGIFRAGEVWHFMGRVGVPISYSWPAGLGGIRGYAYDRESGEFTVSHLRHFLKAVADCPDVERVHVVA